MAGDQASERGPENETEQDPEPLGDPDAIERALVGRPAFTRAQVAEKAGLPVEVAEALWAQLGFPHAGDDDLAFTKADVKALRRTSELIDLGILNEGSQAALVRTWGRSFARLAEWQVNLLAEVAAASDDPEGKLSELMAVAVPTVEELQSYVWRRHLGSAANRLLASQEGATSTQAVCFVDIVGYTSQSRSLDDHELVELVERFEQTLTSLVVEHGGRVIKTIGDEVLFTADDPFAAAEVALAVTALGEDSDEPFPRVRAGIAFGTLVSRLGDVFGPTVNMASRLTSVARPGAVLIDRDAMEVLSSDPEASDDESSGRPIERFIERAAELSPYRRAEGYTFRRLPRRPVKGYKRLEPWVLRWAE